MSNAVRTNSCFDIERAVSRCIGATDGEYGACAHAIDAPPDWPLIAEAVSRLNSPLAQALADVAREAPSRFADVARSACGDPYEGGDAAGTDTNNENAPEGAVPTATSDASASQCHP